MTDHSMPPVSSPLVLDSHIDIPWPDRGDFASGSPQRQVDLPKLRAGGVSAAFLAAYIPQTACDAAEREAAWARVQAMLQVITAPVAGVAICRTADEIVQAHANGQTAIVAAVENGHAIGAEPSRIADLARFGVRYMTLTHNGHNDLADAAIARADLGDAPTRHGGLSALGCETIAAMNRAGIMIDVSHASRETMLQAVELSRAPIVASHSCARALCDHPRNLDDAQLDALKASGGLVQITAMQPFLRAGGGGTLDDFVRHVAYVAERIGVEHVGISSDFDGGGTIAGWRDASETGGVVSALRAHGFDGSELAAICGGNFLARLKAAEAIADPAP